MKPLKLHIKTALLASTITLAVLSAVLVTISTSVVRLAHEDQKELAELQAVNLANHISRLPAPRSDEALLNTARLVRGGRPNLLGVRIWRVTGNDFTPQVATEDCPPAEPPPAEVLRRLKRDQRAGLRSQKYAGPQDSHYHVFAPIIEGRKLAGAVEIIEKLDDFPSIALGYARNALGLALAAVVLTALSIYLLFRQLIYRPIESLLAVIARARGGELAAQAPIRTPDELGLLAREFNTLLGQIHQMTAERQRQQDVLRERVRAATEQLRQRNEELTEANLQLLRTARRLTELERLAAAGQTAAKFAHEVGTPLNLISCHVQLLRDELARDPQAATARTEIIAAQIDRIERIVRQMLDRTRGEAADLAPLDLSALAERVCNITAPLLAERGVRLQKNFAPALPAVAGDAERLQQVFINLINNALDAMPAGGELTVATTAANSPQHPPGVLITMADTGVGMNAATRAHLFDPLYTTKERGKGTGLGLVVVNQVVQEHGGEISVESEAGRGACFRLWFPALTNRTPEGHKENDETHSRSR